jgi:hypothetical protein
MLRHPRGYALANNASDSGLARHRSITPTAVFATLAPERFKDF